MRTGSVHDAGGADPVANLHNMQRGPVQDTPTIEDRTDHLGQLSLGSDIGNEIRKLQQQQQRMSLPRDLNDSAYFTGNTSSNIVGSHAPAPTSPLRSSPQR